MGERRRKEAHYRSLWPVKKVLLEPLSVTAQTTLWNYAGSRSQREPKRPKGDAVRSADFRGVVCGALAPVGDLKRAHNPKVAGSNPAPATRANRALEDGQPPRSFVPFG